MCRVYMYSSISVVLECCTAVIVASFQIFFLYNSVSRFRRKTWTWTYGQWRNQTRHLAIFANGDTGCCQVWRALILFTQLLMETRWQRVDYDVTSAPTAPHLGTMTMTVVTVKTIRIYCNIKKQLLYCSPWSCYSFFRLYAGLVWVPAL